VHLCGFCFLLVEIVLDWQVHAVFSNHRILFSGVQGLPGSRKHRRYLNDNLTDPDSDFTDHEGENDQEWDVVNTLVTLTTLTTLMT
jgi:hypothetical protein